MHSRIFFVSDEPVTDINDVPNASRIDYDYISSRGYDYVDDSSLENDIDWLPGYLNAERYDVAGENGEVVPQYKITLNDRDEHIREVLTATRDLATDCIKQVNTVLAKSEPLVFKDFLDVEMALYRLQHEWDDEFDIQFYYQDVFYSINEFLRINDERKEFYISGSLDYHY